MYSGHFYIFLLFQHSSTEGIQREKNFPNPDLVQVNEKGEQVNDTIVSIVSYYY